MTDSFVKKTVTAIRESRKSDKIEFYAELTAAAQKHQLTHAELAAYGASMLLVAVVELAKTGDASVVEATAAALQVLSEMTQDPQRMVDLWTIS